MDLDMIAVASNRGDPGLNHLFDWRQKPRRPEGRKQTPPLYFKQFPVSPRCDVVQVEHHLAHAASAYYASQFRKKRLS
jgi:predicted NodU family carbamoyl transferase